MNKNRNIKFKIWDVDNKCFIKGECPRFISNLDGIYQFDENFAIYNGALNQKPKNWILLRFTGLQDKNGKEIYEGDLLNYQRSLYTILEVYWNADAAKFNTKVHQQHNKMIYVGPSPMDKLNNYETIGNIFENPELGNVND